MEPEAAVVEEAAAVLLSERVVEEAAVEVEVEVEVEVVWAVQAASALQPSDKRASRKLTRL